MPEYTYFCSHCKINFSIVSSIKKYKDKIQCNVCGTICDRSYNIDLPTIHGGVKLGVSEIKTLGHLAQRNTETMSQDQKDELYRKHNSYKENAPEKPLPKGMTRLKKQPKIQWTAEQTKKERRRIK
jgi:DNA-directed RNA polymerase subunit RPC12/RpoP